MIPVGSIVKFTGRSREKLHPDAWPNGQVSGRVANSGWPIVYFPEVRRENETLLEAGYHVCNPDELEVIR